MSNNKVESCPKQEDILTKEQDTNDADDADSESGDSFVDALDNLAVQNKDVSSPKEQVISSEAVPREQMTSSEAVPREQDREPNSSSSGDESDSDNESSVSESLPEEHGFHDASPEDPEAQEKKADSEKGDGQDSDQIKLDEEALKERDAGLSPEQLEEFHKNSQHLKTEGNESFKSGNYEDAVTKYTEALLTCPFCHIKDRSIMHSNRAAAYMKMDKNEAAIKDSTRAVELNPNYLKALLRRAELYEKTDKLEEALADYQKALEMDPSLRTAREACVRLPEQINERNEKLKAEMLGKLKDLGNLILRPFGLSTDNFNLQQDPNSGSYSVQFQQSPPPQGPS